MKIDDVVHLTDATGVHVGKITAMDVPGLVVVKWYSGITERVPETELTLGAPPDGEPYDPADPKHPGYHDHMAGLWDRRSGK